MQDTDKVAKMENELKDMMSPYSLAILQDNSDDTSNPWVIYNDEVCRFTDIKCIDDKLHDRIRIDHER